MIDPSTLSFIAGFILGFLVAMVVFAYLFYDLVNDKNRIIKTLQTELNYYRAKALGRIK